MEWICLSEQATGVVLRVRVAPNAAKTAAEGLRLDRLSLRVKAPPVEGKANEEVRRWAAKAFGLRASRVSLVRGGHAREKDLLLEGIGLKQAGEVLMRLIGEKPAPST